MKLNVCVFGDATVDLIEALEEVSLLVTNDFIAGADKNETGNYCFTITED